MMSLDGKQSTFNGLDWAPDGPTISGALVGESQPSLRQAHFAVAAGEAFGRPIVSAGSVPGGTAQSRTRSYSGFTALSPQRFRTALSAASDSGKRP